MNRYTLLWTLPIMAMIGLAGCETGHQASREAEPQTDRPPSGDVIDEEREVGYRAAAERRDAERDRDRARTAGQRGRAVLYLPDGDDDSAMLRIVTTGPEEVQKNATHEYEVQATNVSDYHLVDVTLSNFGMEDIEIVGSNPQGTMRGGNMNWNIGHLDPGESETITVEAAARGSGDVLFCMTGDYTPYACLITNAIAPTLQITKDGASQALRCEPIEYTLTVRNTGVGPARDVEIIEELPAGLKTADGKQVVRFDVGTLNAGQSRSHDVEVLASRTGEFTNVARATGANGLSDEARTTTMVRQPVLEITKTGPAEDYQGVPLTYQITVDNVGDAPAREFEILESLPDTVEFVSATNGGQMSDGNVVWNLDTLEAGDSRTVSVTIRSTEQGQLRNVAVARAFCAEDVRATAVTEVVGISALQVEMVDSQDPVRVGDETEYHIVVTNEGSDPARNVTVVAILEDAFSFVDAVGETSGQVSGNRVQFGPLPALQPGESVQWRVRVRAVNPADSRFFIEVTSEILDRPVRETESTKVYEGG